MRRKNFALKTVVILAVLFLMPAPNVRADVCVSDFDYDGNVYPSDLSVFLDEYGTTDCDPNGPAPVEWTGVTLCYEETGDQRDCADTGEDGEYQKGVSWPLPRFANNGDGTATDQLTGLIWLNDANCIMANYPVFDNDGIAGDGAVTWQHALDFVAGINDGTYPLCGAGKTDWRLPNIKELLSLMDYSQTPYALPFLFRTLIVVNEMSYPYWTSTSYVYDTDNAWVVDMGHVYALDYKKSDWYFYVWPVRGGQW